MMKETTNNYKEIIKNYIERTNKNKRYALTMFVIGILSVNVIGEGTFLAAMLLLGLPLFFTKENIFD